MREKQGGMREEVRSSGTADPPFAFARSSSPPATPVASSAGGSSPAPVANAASIDWLGNKPGPHQQPLPSLSTNLDACPNQSRTALSTNLDACANQSRPALSTNLDAGPQESQPSCRPWERGDLLRRLATFKPATWLPKPKAISILSISRRGWLNTDTEKIECESCGARLSFPAPAGSESFDEQLDSGHLPDCPWRGNSCPDSLLQFSLSASALIGGYKDRSDGLLQFVSLPIIATSAIETIRATRGSQLERFLAQPMNFLSGEDPAQLDISSAYAHAQKLISLCGWEPRWLPNIQDCEENSTQSTRPLTESNRRLTVPQKSTKNKGKMPMKESRPTNTRSPLLDCSLCGSTVRIWDFNSVSRLTGNSNPGKKLMRGASAASAINGNNEDGKSLSNADVDLNLTMAGGLPSNQSNFPFVSDQFNRAGMGRDLMIGQPTGSEVGDRAASYESRGPSSRKRNREEGGSTVDKPVHVDRVHQADSIEGTVIDRADGDELDDETETQDSGARNSKRIRGGFDLFGSNRPPRADSSGAGPSRNFSFDGTDLNANNPNLVGPAGRESTRASSVIAMDTVCHGSDNDSMESVENYPAANEADVDNLEVNMNVDGNANLNNEGLDGNNNNSNQAQQSTCVQPGVAREVGGSSTNEGEELLNAETVTANDRLDNRDQVSLGISGGSVGMGASHEAEIHGTEIINDADPIAEVTEGHTGETVPGPLMEEDPRGDSQEQDMVSRSKADSGSKIYGSVKEADSGGRGGEPSLSCNAGIYSAFDAGKEEVSQMGRGNAEFDFDNGLVGATNGENDYETGLGEFDPIRHHKSYCPWVNGNVAVASCEAGQDGSTGSSSGSNSNNNSNVPLCGWQLTLDALDSCQSLGQGQNQIRPSESAASLYKDDHVTPSHKLMSRQSARKSHGKR
ncbi:hypothetical protein LUZ60_010312 [Juncus effusus]|nr:hypothetical protein LUZ60_010312 [Juncus effusus]